jgi:hypothetical protein
MAGGAYHYKKKKYMQRHYAFKPHSSLPSPYRRRGGVEVKHNISWQ